MATAESDEDRRRDALKEANEVLTSAGKWLIGALGAIGAVLIAGSQLSSIGTLRIGPRFVAALIGLGIGLAAVLWCIWRVVDLLAPERYSISGLAKEWDASGSIKGVGVRTRRGRRRYPVPDWFGKNPEHLANHESPTQLLAHWNDRTACDREKVLEAINDMVRLANFQRNRAKFVQTKRPLGLGIMAAAAGICVFAWAANPGAEPPPSLRNARLTDADLRGSSLIGVDLSGAILVRVNLRGATLRGSTLEGVTWIDTICPDGTNSDDTRGASQEPGSCAGHLNP